jgi:NADH:ubiquinone oxidoreductase subunit C
MSSLVSHDPAPKWVREAIKPGLAEADLEARLTKAFPLTRDARDKWSLTLVLSPDFTGQFHALAKFLRDDPDLQFTTLLDVAGVDYMSYPNHRGPRFAVQYLFKSLVFKHRVRIKVELDEEAANVATLSDLYAIADWSERETWDQYGINFVGHPNQRRLLNHHEFVGHPLRKDYPCQKRQKLSINDPMVGELTARLNHLGWKVLEAGEVHIGDRIAAPSSDPASVPGAKSQPAGAAFEVGAATGKAT